MFDTSSFRVMLSKVDVLFGGRSKLFVDNLDHFLKVLQDNDVAMMFFGNSFRKNYDDEKHESNYDKLIKTFNNIGKNETVQQVLERVPTLRSRMYCKKPIKECVIKYGPFRMISEFEDRDQEMAKYATEHKAMAIVTQNSEFCIFSGEWSYWSMQCLNLIDLTTKEYSRVALRSYLKMSTEQMFLFATLCGNNFVSFNDLKLSYYGGLRFGCFKTFYSIASFVRSITAANNICNLTEYQILQIIWQCIPNDYVDEYIDDFLQGIRFYDTNRLEINQTPVVNAQQESLPAMAPEILNENNIHTSLSVVFADLRSENYWEYPKVLLAWQKRLIGIVLRHKNDNTLTRKVYIKLSYNDPIKLVEVCPDYPDSKFILSFFSGCKFTQSNILQCQYPTYWSWSIQNLYRYPTTTDINYFRGSYWKLKPLDQKFKVFLVNM